jgi:catechol 2,3-dioxygenase-like lactoylglutathione lyase family enzyme
MDRIDHVNLVVGDLETMAAFYRDTLGLAVTKRITICGPWIEAITGLAGAEADVVYLEPASGPGVELICYRTPGASRPERLGEANTPGLRHVAFQVDDLAGLLQQLRAAHAPVLSDVQEVPTEQVEFGGRQKRIVYCRDPEGNLLELCQFE